MASKERSSEEKILIEKSFRPIVVNEARRNADCHGALLPNGSHLVPTTTSLLDRRPSRIDSSYEDCKSLTNSGNSSSGDDSIDDFFGTSSRTKSCSSHQTTFPHTNDDNEEGSDNLRLVNYFPFLDDYIRFDVSRAGVSCFAGYSVSVQYEDEFLVGDGGNLLASLMCGTRSRVRLWHKKEIAFELEYHAGASCTRPKDCIYRVKTVHQKTEIGTIHFQDDLVRVYNSCEEFLSFRRKQDENIYMIRTEDGERQASIELFRGFRGDIIYYGLSILGEASNIDKALLIALAITMDIRQRESQMRCSFLWVPLCCLLIVGFFTVIPLLYFTKDNS